MHINFIDENRNVEGGGCKCCQREYLLVDDKFIDTDWANREGEDAETLLYEYIFRTSTQLERAKKLLDFIMEQSAARETARDQHAEP